MQLASDYANHGVEVVAINVNNSEADNLPAMKQRAREKGFKFAYLYDPTQAIGRASPETRARCPYVPTLPRHTNVSLPTKQPPGSPLLLILA